MLFKKYKFIKFQHILRIYLEIKQFQITETVQSSLNLFYRLFTKQDFLIQQVPIDWLLN